MVRLAEAYVRAFPREERWLHALTGTGFFVALSAGVGTPNVASLAGGYFQYFAKYLAGLFFLSRIHVVVREKWRPSGGAARRIKSWFFGPDATTPELAPFERALFPNRAEVAGRPIANVAMDLVLVRLVLTFLLVLAVYTSVKTRLPYLGGFEGTDAIFQRWDDALFGPSFGRWLEGWARGDEDVMRFLSETYVHGYVWFVLLLVLLYLRRDAFSLRWLVVSVGTVYLVAILISSLLPALGPCFVDPARFAWIRTELVGESQHFLAYSFNESQRATAAGLPIEVHIFAGIAAFPSLHVGHMVVLACVAARTVPAYVVVLTWTTLWTFVATIAFGWHYAVDAVAGIALAVAITLATRMAMLRWDAAETEERPARG